MSTGVTHGNDWRWRLDYADRQETVSVIERAEPRLEGRRTVAFGFARALEPAPAAACPSEVEILEGTW